MKILQLFTYSSIAASLIHLAFFGITALLDTIINSELANFIGLVIDLILDFIVQQYIFMKTVKPDIKIIIKYISSELLFIFINQLIFTIYYRYYYNKNHNLTLVRIIISICIYCLIVFPARKYFIFK